MLLVCVLYTIMTIYIVNIPERPQSSLTYFFNIVGGSILTEYVYKKHFPNSSVYQHKKIWKPLIICILILIPILFAMILEL